jgi:hypothetical protein
MTIVLQLQSHIDKSHFCSLIIYFNTLQRFKKSNNRTLVILYKDRETHVGKQTKHT